MKSFKEYITEMAPARSSDHGKKYYHGFSDEKNLQSIMTNGLQPPDLSSRSGNLRPVDGKVYITTHIDYAVIYCLGGDVAGHAVNEYDITVKGQFGYLCVVYGNKIHTIQPDEDDVGKFISQESMDWLNELAEDELTNEDYDNTFEDEDGNEVSDDRSLYRAVMDGEYDAWAMAGKLLIPLMTDDQKLELIDAGAHIAHGGTLIPDEIWKFDKRQTPDLERSGSNFFDLAERIS